VLAILLGAFSIAEAGAVPYDLGGTGNWTGSSTWNPAIDGGPTATDTISITNPGAERTVTINGTAGLTYTVAGFSYNTTWTTIFRNNNSGSKQLLISGDLIKNGTGELKFLQTANNSYLDITILGNLSLNSGTLSFGTGSNGMGAVQVSGSSTVSSGATLNLGLHYATGSTFNFGTTTLEGTLHLGAAESVLGGAHKTVSFNTLNGSGSISVGQDISNERTTTLEFTQGAGVTGSFSGSITDATNLRYALRANGGGRQILSGELSYQGGTMINAGSLLQFGGKENGESGVGSGYIEIRDGTLENGGSILGLGHDSGLFTRQASSATATGAILVRNYGGFAAYHRDQTVILTNSGGNPDLSWGSADFLVEALVLSHSSATHTLTLASNLALGSGSRTVLVHNGAAAIDGALSGVLSGNSGALIKAGAGTLAMSGANTYANGTTLTAGRLLVDNESGSATGSGTVSLAQGAILGGGNATASRGFIAGQVVSAGTGSVLEPGLDGVGILTLSGGLDASAGATFRFDLGLTGDRIDLGNLIGSSMEEGLVFEFNAQTGIGNGQVYELLRFSGATGLEYSDLSLGMITPWIALDTSYGTGGFLIDSQSGTLSARFMVVPEPFTGGLVLFGLGAYAACTRLRRKRKEAPAR